MLRHWHTARGCIIAGECVCWCRATLCEQRARTYLWGLNAVAPRSAPKSRYTDGLPFVVGVYRTVIGRLVLELGSMPPIQDY
eukprot:m.191513 g.191513  ORF g.191513 m.191513 type:complete len:82 (-) comp24925_c0_seq1:1152-1397(-)